VRDKFVQWKDTPKFVGSNVCHIHKIKTPGKKKERQIKSHTF